jgi:hypothetical protein
VVAGFKAREGGKPAGKIMWWVDSVAALKEGWYIFAKPGLATTCRVSCTSMLSKHQVLKLCPCIVRPRPHAFDVLSTVKYVHIRP